jgi:tripartite-type tricarboxylate transporter receptor subunit TctC
MRFSILALAGMSLQPISLYGIFRRTGKVLAFGLGLLFLLIGPGNAQEFPNRPVRIVVPDSANGVTANLARTLADQLSKQFRQEVRIEPIPEQGVASARVARSPPDGYTLLFGTTTSHTIPGLERAAYDPVSDFAPVTLIAKVPTVLVVPNSLKVNSVSELLAYGKANRLYWGSTGRGSPSYLAGELFRQRAGINMTLIPYDAGAPAITDVTSGKIDLYFDSLSSALPNIQQGKVKALAVTGSERFPTLPNVPTMEQAGLAGYEASTWIGVLAPKGTPSAVIEILNRNIRSAVESPDLKARLLGLGTTRTSGSPGDFAVVVRNDTRKWATVIAPPKVAPPPAPPPTARPPPQPDPIDPSRVIDSAQTTPSAVQTYWNTWFEDDGKSYEVLQTLSSYHVVLDLSRYSYLDDFVAAASDLNAELTRAVKLNRTQLDLNVQVVLLSDALEFVDASKQAQVIAVNLAAVRQSRDAEFVADRKRLLEGASPSVLPELSSKYSAGKFPIPLVIRTKGQGGCAQVAFSIWDSGFSRPLDHIVLTVPIRAGDGAPIPKCPDPRVQGGFAALSGALSAVNAPQVDAALHLFEFASSGSIRTAAIYVDEQVFASSKPEQLARDRGIYSWFVPGSLRTYVSSDLVAAVTTGRSAGTYAQAADELQRKVFRSDANPANDPAQLAFDSLVRIANVKPTTPIVLVRAILADGHAMYLPLALLATKGGKLSKRPSFVYPMPRENYSDDACVGNWTLGIPEAIPDDQTISIPDADLSNLLTPLLRSLPALMTYLDPPPVAAPTTSATSTSEALVLLAHQANGRLWFKGKDGAQERLFYTDIRRTFSNGSIAVLAACGTASPDNGNQLVLERLNLKGVDGMVVSPFPVPEDYGTALTLAVVHIVNEARQQKIPLTLLQIFDQAIEYVVTQEAPDTLPAAIRERRRQDLREKALEFIITGNHTAKLCVQP